MKFNLEKDSTVSEINVCTDDLKESLFAIQEDVHAAYQGMLELEPRIEELGTIVSNIDFTMNAIQKYGDQAIVILNSDNSLFDLMESTNFCVEELNVKLSNTKIVAMEGFVDNVKAFIKKLIEFVKRVFTKIRQTLLVIANDKEGIINQITDEQISTLIKTSGNRGNASNGIFTRQGFLCFEMHSNNVIDLLDSTIKASLSNSLENLEKHRIMVSRCVFELKRDIDSGIIDMSVGLGKKSLTSSHVVNEISDTVSNIKKEREKMMNVLCHSSIDIRTGADLKTIYKTSTDYLKKVELALRGLDREIEKTYNLADNSGIPTTSGYHQVLYECASGYGIISGSLAKMSNCLYSMTRGCQKFAMSIVKNTKLI